MATGDARDVDVIVTGGGLSGSAIALELVHQRAAMAALFDEKRPTRRLPPGNFGFCLAHVQGWNRPLILVSAMDALRCKVLGVWVDLLLRVGVIPGTHLSLSPGWPQRI